MQTHNGAKKNFCPLLGLGKKNSFPYETNSRNRSEIDSEIHSLFLCVKKKEQRFAAICCQVISVDSLTLLSPQAAYYIDYRDTPLSLLSLYSIRVKKNFTGKVKFLCNKKIDVRNDESDQMPMLAPSSIGHEKFSLLTKFFYNNSPKPTIYSIVRDRLLK